MLASFTHKYATLFTATRRVAGGMLQVADGKCRGNSNSSQLTATDNSNTSGNINNK